MEDDELRRLLQINKDKELAASKLLIAVLDETSDEDPGLVRVQM